MTKMTSAYANKMLRKLNEDNLQNTGLTAAGA